MNEQVLIQRIINSSKDYYDVLQVDRDASPSTIRRSYYKLSLRLHPDKTLDNNEQSKQAFQIVSRSYEVLRDPTTRAIYNRLGANGLESFQSVYDDMPSAFEFILMFVRIFLLKLIQHAACRMGASSLIKHIKFSFFNPSSGEKEFYIQCSEEWVHFRRRVVNCFVGVIAFFLILLSFDPIYVFFYGAGLSNHPIGAEETKDVLFFVSPFKGSRKVYNREEPLSIYPTCFLEADSRSFIVCHERLSLLERLASDTKQPLEKWFVERYTESEEAVRVSFYTFLTAECEREELLIWASRERFEQTATLRRKLQPLNMNNPNRLPKRKYPEKKWYSRFHESFSVAKAEELYHPLPFCEQLWRQRPLVGVA
ncbi:unnamed protein product [Phytomonas sp. Hart1]|nr:unnamed protein product [Phytomonas sp. Hart1]|eukprot:CCW66514.1 unnamed protein product [Phytomonas sp. isolate Hart1]